MIDKMSWYVTKTIKNNNTENPTSVFVLGSLHSGLRSSRQGKEDVPPSNAGIGSKLKFPTANWLQRSRRTILPPLRTASPINMPIWMGPPNHPLTLGRLASTKKIEGRLGHEDDAFCAQTCFSKRIVSALYPPASLAIAAKFRLILGVSSSSLVVHYEPIRL